MTRISRTNNAIHEQQMMLPVRIQRMLSIFAFFLAFPAINILGLSITFYLFFIILFMQGRTAIAINTHHKLNTWFYLLFILGAISTFAHPPLEREISVMANVRIVLQFLYWILLALYIRSNYHLINWYKFTQWLFYGLIALVIGFYFIKLSFDSPLFGYSSRLSRNSFIFNFLCFFPLIFWYAEKSWLRNIRLILVAAFVLAILFSNGRSGFVLIIIQAILTGMIIFPKRSKVFQLSLIGVFMLFLVWQTAKDSPMLDAIASSVELVNPRAANLVRKEGVEGDLSFDKSWLMRKLMVDKSLEIVNKYPFLGIGWLHFSNYGADLRTLDEYSRLGTDQDMLNSKSAHNSYAQYLAEGGILGFGALVIILLSAILPFIRKVAGNKLQFIDLPLVAMGTIAIYFYSIAVITGAGTWFVIGAALGTISQQKASPGSRKKPSIPNQPLNQRYLQNNESV